MGSGTSVHRAAGLHTTQRQTAADVVRIIVRQGVDRIRQWRARARTRRQLAAMGERDLNDLGLSPSSIAYEVNKAFWRE